MKSEYLPVIKIKLADIAGHLFHWEVYTKDLINDLVD